MEMGNSTLEEERRRPLSLVVAKCVKRWFEVTLVEAEDGDLNMQVLVGQMYHSGFGVQKDSYKGRAWIERASKSRLSALLVEYKHPGETNTKYENRVSPNILDNFVSISNFAIWATLESSINTSEL